MATFQARIEDRIGTQSDVDALSDWLTEGAKFITNLLPYERMEKFSAPLTAGILGISVAAHRILRVHKSGYGARRVDAGLAAAIVDADSIHKALTTDPVWYIIDGLVYIHPSGGTVIAMAYPTVLYNATTITDFPADLIEAVILFASIQGRLRQMSDLTNLTLGVLTIREIISPSSLGAPSFSWTPVTYSDAVYSIADYIPALYSDAEYVSAAYSAASAVDAAISNIMPVTVFFNDVLEYIPPVFGGSYTGTDTSLGNQDIDLSTAHLNKIQTQLGQMEKELLNSLNSFNKDKGEFDAKLQIAISEAQLAQQRVTEEARNIIELNKFNEQQTLQAALTNAQQTSQIDLANRQAELQTQLANNAKELEAALTNASQEAQVDLANRRAALELDITNKSKALEVAVINSSKALEAHIAEYTVQLQAYGAVIGLYSAEVNQEISRVTTRINQYSSMFQQFSLGLEALKQEFQNYIKVI